MIDVAGLQKMIDENDMGNFLLTAKKELPPAIIQKIISGKRKGVSVEEVLKQNGIK